jgi:hypothetical protein
MAQKAVGTRDAYDWFLLHILSENVQFIFFFGFLFLNLFFGQIHLIFFCNFIIIQHTPPISKAMSKTKSESNQRVAWLKAVQGLDKSIKSLLSKHEELEKLTAEGLQSIENERNAAKNALDVELMDIDATRKRRLLDSEIELERKQRDGAVAILTKTNEEPILTTKKAEFETLLAKLQAENSEAIKEAEDKVRKQLCMTHRMEMERTKLEYEKDQAALTEHSKALQSQINQKDQIISNMREDAINLQGLVQGVAEASNRPVSFVPQGK